MRNRRNAAVPPRNPHRKRRPSMVEGSATQKLKLPGASRDLAKLSDESPRSNDSEVFVGLDESRFNKK